MNQKALGGMHEASYASTIEQVEFTFGDILTIIWRRKHVVLITAAICIVFMSIAMLLMTPVYRAQMQIVPTENKLTEDLDTTQSAAHLLGGLTGNTDTALPIDLYTDMFSTLEMAQRLNQEHNLLHIIYAHRWDAIHQKWKPNPNPISFLSRTLRRMFHIPGTDNPTLEDLRTYLKRSVYITPLSGEGVRLVTFENPDPVIALNTLKWLDETSEQILRQRDFNRYQRQVDYLSKTLMTVTQNEQRQALIKLLERQDQQLMLIGSDPEYAATIFEAPFVSPNPVRPNPPVMLLIALVGGTIIGLAIASAPLMFRRRL